MTIAPFAPSEVGGSSAGWSSRPVSEAAPALTLGLRLLALAVVAGSGALLPDTAGSRSALAAGVILGAGIGLLQYLAVRRRWDSAGLLLVMAQIGVWTFLVHRSGGNASPLFVGYLLELPLSGLMFGKRGCVLAAVASIVAYVGRGVLFRDPLDPVVVATVSGFIAVGAVLTWFLIEALARLWGRVEASRAALAARAENLSEELRMLGDYLSGALVGIDASGRVASLNPAGAALLGLPPGQGVGLPWQELLRPSSESADRIATTLAEGTAQRGVDLVFERAGAPAVAARGELWMSPSSAGRMTFLLLSPAAVEHATSDPLRRLGEAAGCVAHQIKNSLHALQCLALGVGDRARESAGPDAQPSHFALAVRSLSDLAEDVLSMAGASRQSVEPVPLDAVIASAALLTGASRSRIDIDLPERSLEATANRGQLVHALFNLLDNACRATPTDERIRIEARPENGCVRIDILDSGPGIPSEVAAARDPVASANGSGLGLLAARRFIEACAGTLSFHSRPGGGTCSRVILPAAGAILAVPRECDARRTEAPGYPPPRRT